MKRVLLFAPLLSAGAGAQDVVIRDPGPGGTAAIVRTIAESPHVLRAGTAPLVLPRDSTITENLLVLGRPTYLASTVQGDVVVVGADLFLRPGVDVTGRAVAIGGTVTETTLGRVGSGVYSFRDETFNFTLSGDQYLLDYRSRRAEDAGEPTFQLAGFKGVKVPGYDRVDGLSLPVGVLLQFGDHALELEPYATYRSRLGVVDPALQIRTREGAPWRFLARGARDTRTNDAWIYSDLVNSVTTFWAGSDTRNYFRSDLGEARVVRRLEFPTFLLSPYLGGRFERVKAITAVGNVWSVFGRTDSLRMARPNPLVERGNIGSAMAGAAFQTVGFATSLVLLDVEQGFSAPTGASTFTQVTLDGSLELPSFRTQTLKMHGHFVGTSTADAPRSRYAYLGGSGTLATLDLLEMGGTSLVYLESRYLIPLEKIQLPVVGSPTLTLRDAFGSAGVGGLPEFQHELGVGIGLNVLRLEYTVAVAGKSGSRFGIGISLSPF